MKKKILALLLSACMVGSLVGCSGSQLSNEYITITQYKGLEVAEVEVTEVTDEMIDSEIELRLAETTVTGRPAEDGDTVNIDFMGYMDGELFDGGTASDVDVEIGSGALIGATENYKGFEEQLIGHEVGETFTIDVQFPAEYSVNPDYENCVAQFEITLNSIQPELTDDWVKENSEDSETIEEFREEVKEYMTEIYEDDAHYELQNEVLIALTDATEVTAFPEGEVEAMVQEAVDYYTSYAESMGMTYEDFLTMYGLTAEDMEADLTASAEKSLTQELAVKLLAEKKRLEPTEEEYQEKMEEYVELYGYESVDDMLEQAGEDVVRDSILMEAVADYLIKSCVQVEATEETTTDTTTTTE